MHIHSTNYDCFVFQIWLIMSSAIGTEKISTPYSNKSPVTMLYEYSAKEKINSPLFCYKMDDRFHVVECRFNNFIGIGKDAIKKKAKEIAADIVVKHFDIQEYFIINN